MKKIILILTCAITIIGCNSPATNAEYKLTPELLGLGCIRLGSSFQEVSQSIDSSYMVNKTLLDSKYIRKSEMLENSKLMYSKIPQKYTSEYRCYQATLVISDDLIIENAQLYFWRDTLHRIWISNSNACAGDVGNALVWKYGTGEGYYSKTNNRESQQHLWGNDFCIANYKSDVSYIIGDNGLAKGVGKWFREVDIRLNNPSIEQRIANYLNRADSLWKADTYNGI